MYFLVLAAAVAGVPTILVATNAARSNRRLLVTVVGCVAALVALGPLDPNRSSSTAQAWLWPTFALALPSAVALSIRIAAATRFRRGIQWLVGLIAGIGITGAISLLAVNLAGTTQP
jgi:hypothetical protein